MDLHTHPNGLTFGDPPLQEYQNRYFELRKIQDAKNVLIEDLLIQVSMLTKDNKQLRLDLERATEFNREYQERRKEWEADMRRLRGVMDRNPFVLILLDGDGMIFQDHLLQQGEQGGKEAAGQLWKAIRDYIQKEFTTWSSEIKIVCRVYGNVKGLAETCYRANIVDKVSKVEEFARGFSRNKHLFDWIDVGSGKDRADGKLSEIFKLHLYDCHCKQIFFGGSHDNGYARLLEDCCTSDIEYTKRITLVEGFPFEREIRALQRHFGTTTLQDLFRSNKIVVGQPQAVSTTKATNSHSSTTSPIQQSLAMSRTTTNSSNHGYTLTNVSTSDTSNNGTDGTVLLPTSFSVNPVPQTWVSAATASRMILASPPSTPQPPSTSSTSTSTSDPTILRNRKGQRLDVDLKYDKTDVKRVKALKMCNVHFLRGSCQHGSECSHDHSYKPSNKELSVVRYIARLAPCKYGTECDDPKCIYGHRCPAGNLSSDGSCPWWGDRCRFPEEMHHADIVPVKGIKI